LDADVVSKVSQKIEEMCSDESIVQAVEYFLVVLVNKIDHLRQALHVYERWYYRNADREDY
jgi:hypothetical protein